MRSAASRGGGAARQAERNEINDPSYSAPDPCPQVLEAPPTWRPIGAVGEHLITDQRRQRQAERLHALGPRPMYEAMRELVRYARLDVDTVAALGGDRFAPRPLHEVA